jgi:uncharacterized membrane-anchored protein YjiN (DUF445 family)
MEKNLCLGCVHQSVCGEKEKFAEILKDLNLVDSLMDGDLASRLVCKEYISKEAKASEKIDIETLIDKVVNETIDEIIEEMIEKVIETMMEEDDKEEKENELLKSLENNEDGILDEMLGLVKTIIGEDNIDSFIQLGSVIKSDDEGFNKFVEIISKELKTDKKTESAEKCNKDCCNCTLCNL